MRRRALLGLLGASLWPRLSYGQSTTRMTRVGLVSLVLSEGSDMGWWEPFFARMRQNGYREGQTVQYLTTRAGGRPELLDQSISELLRQRPNVLVTTGVRETRAASRAAPSTPVISFLVPDAVEAGLAASLARPGGNVTGLNTAGPEIEIKRLELLQEFDPQARRLAVLGSTGQQASSSRQRIKAAQDAAQWSAS